MACLCNCQKELCAENKLEKFHLCTGNAVEQINVQQYSSRFPFPSSHIEQSGGKGKHVCYTSLTAVSCNIATNALRLISFPPMSLISSLYLLSLILTTKQNQTYASDPLSLGYQSLNKGRLSLPNQTRLIESRAR